MSPSTVGLMSLVERRKCTAAARNSVADSVAVMEGPERVRLSAYDETRSGRTAEFERVSRVAMSAVARSSDFVRNIATRSSVLKRVLLALRRVGTRSTRDRAQVSSRTSENRYPEVFDFVTAWLESSEPPRRILSFGCSTGQECCALADRNGSAQIVGLDTQKGLLRKARRENSRGQVEYVRAGSQRARSLGEFDVVLAMSVLCLWPETEFSETSDMWPFTRFEASLGEVISLARVGGLVVVYNANYRPLDTKWRTKLVEFGPTELAGGQYVKLFGPGNLPAPRRFSAGRVFTHGLSFRISLRRSARRCNRVGSWNGPLALAVIVDRTNNLLGMPDRFDLEADPTALYGPCCRGVHWPW